jgi:short-subunit dehydrogenase
MRVTLKPLHDQVVVITGASSGIGLCTARMAAERGARVVMMSRDEDELNGHVGAIRETGGTALGAAGDVADAGAVNRLAQLAVESFGRIDTWINNAGVSVYGRTLEVPVSDERRLFDVNYWGTVNGCRAAVPHLREHGGALINVGSITSDRAVPLQAAYSASKHAVKGYIDALRMELEREGAPIAVTLVKPAAIDTPYFEHAANYMEQEPAPPPPVYAPEVVARAILRCAERPTRDVTVGGGGRAMTLMGAVAPRLADRLMTRTMFDLQKGAHVSRDREGALRHPRGDGTEEGAYRGHVMRSSIYTSAMLSDAARALPLIALGLAIGLGVLRRRR